VPAVLLDADGADDALEPDAVDPDALDDEGDEDGELELALLELGEADELADEPLLIVAFVKINDAPFPDADCELDAVPLVPVAPLAPPERAMHPVIWTAFASALLDDCDPARVAELDCVLDDPLCAESCAASATAQPNATAIIAPVPNRFMHASVC